MKTLKAMSVLLVIGCLVSFSACRQPATLADLHFNPISSPLKVVPDDLNHPNNGFYHMVETLNGKKEQLFKKFYIANALKSTPIYKSSDTSYLLVYASRLLNLEYQLGEKKIRDPQTGSFFGANEGSINNTWSFLSVSYNPELKMGDIVYALGQVGKTGGIFIEGTPNDESSLLFAANTTIPISNVSSIDGYLLYPGKYSYCSASLNGKYMYYDFIDKSLKPTIYKIAKLKNGNGTLLKENARYPVVSDDDTIFAYSHSDNASFDDYCKWQTIIEKDGKVEKKFDAEQIILMNQKGKTIYAIDPESCVVQKLDMTSFKVIATGKVDQGLIFPQIVEGKLQYTAPVYKDGKITDYAVKQES